MADEGTYLDSLRLFHTGAASHQAAQPDVDACLGNYLASNEIPLLGATRATPIANIDLDYVAGPNGSGIGSLTAPTADTLKWTPPGGTQGAAVTIANGQTRLILAGGANGNNQHVRCTRTSADALSGTETVTLAYELQNALSYIDLTNAERLAGILHYWAIGFQSQRSADPIRSLKVWLASLGSDGTVSAAGYAASGGVTITSKDDISDWPTQGIYLINQDTGEVMYAVARSGNVLTVEAGGRDVWSDVGGGAAGSEDETLLWIPPYRLAAEAPSAEPGGYIQTIANDETAPGGVSWTHPTGPTDAGVISIGDLAAGYWHGLWICRKILAGTTAHLTYPGAIEWQFEGPQEA